LDGNLAYYYLVLGFTLVLGLLAVGPAALALG
jgi:hypothetical protein